MTAAVTSGTTPAARQLRVAGLFAGIGGLEAGLARHGHHAELLCEIDPRAQAVLAKRFEGVPIESDIRKLRELPPVDLVAAGFPCQDLSLAGTQHGIRGAKSGLVTHLLRLLRKSPPELVLLENVLYFIKRDYGAQLRFVTERLERLGYRWAYRVVDTRGFGLPQRRQRVVLLASAGDVDPVDVLFRQRVQAKIDDRIQVEPGAHYGFYWTEGKRAVGWAKEAVPTIKGGSGLGIPSPPAVYDAERGAAGTPTIRDGERLQGFEAGWTDVGLAGSPLKIGHRWTLIGNAVSVPVADWIGRELRCGGSAVTPPPVGPVVPGKPMPMGAAGSRGRMDRYDISLHVEEATHDPISGFLSEPLRPLSEKALRGFLRRAESGIMTLPAEFIAALEVQAKSGQRDALPR